METFGAIVNSEKPLTTIANLSVLDVCRGHDFVSTCGILGGLRYRNSY